MTKTDLDPTRDAGKFAYHLRKMCRTSLIAKDEKIKKYKLTSLGERLLDFASSLEEYATKSGEELFVRTSKLAMEEFDRNKIAKVLIEEAGMPAKLANTIAEEAEARLLKLNVAYLTSSLIREFVNMALIEKGFHEYRDKLVRLGLPVYDMTQLINATDNSHQNVESINKAAGESVLKEYTLLNVLPRSITDAHLSGMIHINNISYWILKPYEFQHDLRPFFQKGYGSIQRGSEVTIDPPTTFEAAVSLTYSLIETSGTELAGEQALNYFNIFLAPFVRDLTKDDVKRTLSHFILSLNTAPSSKGWPTEITIGVDPSIPQNLEEATAFGPNGKPAGSYGDYFSESQKILDSLLDIFVEESTRECFFTPNLIFNIRRETLKSREPENLLLKVHDLSAKTGKPFFANLVPQWQKDALYFATGTRLAPSWTKDWEIDTLRTGNLDTVAINLPRLAYTAQGNDNKLFESLGDCTKKAAEALQLKNRAMEDRRRRSLLPHLFQHIARKPYLRLKSASNLVGFIGLNEAVRIHTGDFVYGSRKSADFAVDVIKNLSLRAKKLSQMFGLRIGVSQVSNSEAAQRLAGLDVERYGWEIVTAQGTKESPYYTDLVVIPLEAKVSLRDRLKIESELHPLTLDGHLSLIELEEPEQDPENLLKMTRRICLSKNIGAFAYTRSFSHCKKCRRVFGGHPQKCPDCKSANSLTYYCRQSAKYKPLKYWTAAKKATIGKRVRYRV